MQVEFLQLHDDGTVDARLEPGWQIFNDALADAVSSLPPRGSKEQRLSTYWIDSALDRLSRLQGAHEDGMIASGNAYSILLSGDRVTAAFDYGDEDTFEAMPIEDFVDLLERWRQRVIDVQPYETREVPETYRRNPWP